MEYYLYLPNTREYIKETNDDRIWIKTDCINDAFQENCLLGAINVAKYVCNQKGLKLNSDLIIIREWFELKREVVYCE